VTKRYVAKYRKLFGLSVVDVVLPAKRQNLTYSGTHVERGKPIYLPIRESEPQGEPTVVWAWDSRKSEGHLVMRWIEVETLLYAKASRLRRWSLWTRTDDESTSRRKANEGSGNTSLCAFYRLWVWTAS
jgi:hypothetical protein